MLPRQSMINREDAINLDIGVAQWLFEQSNPSHTAIPEFTLRVAASDYLHEMASRAELLLIGLSLPCRYNTVGVIQGSYSPIPTLYSHLAMVHLANLPESQRWYARVNPINTGTFEGYDDYSPATFDETLVRALAQTQAPAGLPTPSCYVCERRAPANYACKLCNRPVCARHAGLLKYLEPMRLSMLTEELFNDTKNMISPRVLYDRACPGCLDVNKRGAENEPRELPG